MLFQCGKGTLSNRSAGRDSCGARRSRRRGADVRQSACHAGSGCSDEYAPRDDHRFNLNIDKYLQTNRPVASSNSVWLGGTMAGAQPEH